MVITWMVLSRSSESLSSWSASSMPKSSIERDFAFSLWIFRTSASSSMGRSSSLDWSFNLKENNNNKTWRPESKILRTYLFAKDEQVMRRSEKHLIPHSQHYRHYNTSSFSYPIWLSFLLLPPLPVHPFHLLHLQISAVNILPVLQLNTIQSDGRCIISPQNQYESIQRAYWTQKSYYLVHDLIRTKYDILCSLVIRHYSQLLLQ